MNLPEPQGLSFSDLMNGIESGRLKIPQFQREFVWELEKSRALMDSILKGYPIGTFIIWKTKDRLRYIKDIGNEKLPDPPEGDYVNFVLDGQQRITTIYACMKGVEIMRENRNVDYSEIYVDLEASEEDQVVIDNIEQKEEDSIIKITDLYSQGFRFLGEFPEKYHKKLEDYQKRINNYRFSIINVKEVEIDVATEIFTRLNISGKDLTLFEIMVAKTFDPEKNFDLFEKFEAFMQRLENANYETISDSIILQTISLILENSCTRKQILKLDKQKFIDKWDESIDAIERAIDYFSSKYHIPVSKLLPYDALLVPFSYFFYHQKDRPVGEKSKYLEDFFWRCSIAERYSSGRESKLAQDIERMDLILKGVLPKYDWPIDYSSEYIKEYGYFSTGRSFIKAILSIYAYFEPKSFVDNAKVKIGNSWLKQANSKNYHHFFPRAYLKSRGIDDDYANHILNITIVDDYLNKRLIGAKAPSKYMKEFEEKNPDISQTMITHLIPDLNQYGIWNDDYDTFINKRAKLVSKELEKRIIKQELIEEATIEKVSGISQEQTSQDSDYLNLKTSLNFIQEDIRKIVVRHAKKSSRNVRYFCNEVLKNKTKWICYELNKNLKEKGLKTIQKEMIEKIKNSDKDLKDVSWDDISEEDLIVNFHRLKRIVKDLITNVWVSKDAILYLMNYLEIWLNTKILEAIKTMSKKDPWRITLKVRDFQI